MSKNRLVHLCLILVLSLSLVGSLVNPSAASLPQEQGEASSFVVARVYFFDRAQLDWLASRLDIWEVNHAGGYLVAMLSSTRYEQLRQAGYRVEIDPLKTEQINQPLIPLAGQSTESIPGYSCYRTVAETYADLDALTAANPGLVELIDIGDSWDKITPDDPEDPEPLPGFDLLMLRLTNESRAEKYGRFFLMAEVHAREYVTSETALRMAEHLVSNYNLDPDITWMLDYFEIYILPMSNPDGRIFAETGEMWRKNTDNDDGCTLYPVYGTDLNRNNDFHWGGAGTDPCGETYQGPAPNSEPETLSIQNQVLALFPDQRGEDDNDAAPADTTGLFITLHSFSELIIWPWGWTNSDSPNHEQLQTLGRKMAYFNGYAPSQAYELYQTTGTNDDWAYGTLGIAAYTYEMGTTFFQDCTSFESTIYPDNLEALLNAFKAARRPYQNPAGPESLMVNINSEPVIPGTLLTLTARANDTRYFDTDGTEPVQNIAEARYSIDNPSWVAGTPTYPMSPSDGAFDAEVEDIQATIDTTGWSNGRHMIFIESRDADGNWGYTSAAFTYILDPLTAPHITGTVKDAASGDPIEATIGAGQFQTTSDPQTGAYELIVYSGTYTVTASAAYYVSQSVADVSVADGQTYSQDFELERMCDIFSDDAESGNLGWTAQAPWAISEEASYSPSHAWTDSPGGYYANKLNTSLTSPTFNLQDWDDIGLLFWHTYDIQTRYDWGIVEYSIDDGATWIETARFNGIQEAWGMEALELPGLAGVEKARIRFRLTTDNVIVRDGWHIDDIQLMGTGPGCTPQYPMAEFTSNSPVEVGTPVIFSNLSTGTSPLTYLWDFGDGSGTSTNENPTYTYAEAGTYTVTLTASNDQGSSSVSHPVVVELPACTPLTALTLDTPTMMPTHPGDDVDFTVSVIPEDSSKPITYTVDFGDGSKDEISSSDEILLLSHAYAATGEYTVEISAWNCSAVEPVSASLTISVTNYTSFLPLAAKSNPINEQALQDQAGSSLVLSILPAAGLLSATINLPVFKKIR